MKRPLFLIASVCLAVGLVFPQASPPGYMNYQGVLRDASDSPLEGAHDMVFRFYDDAGDVTCAGGTLLLTDAHEAAGSGAVEVNGGMFNVNLGGGTVTPGTVSTLADVFRNNAEVWLEATVGAEKLCPRVRVMSAGYALNSSYLNGHDSAYFGQRNVTNTWTGGNFFTNPANIFTGDGSGLTGVTAGDAGLLDGYDSTYFLDTGSTQQTKAGALIINESGAVVPAITATANFYGIEAAGNSAGGYFRDGNDSGYAYIGNGNIGVRGYGNAAGGSFLDLDSSGEAYAAYGDIGIQAEGDLAAGYFIDSDGTDTFSYLGYANYGIWGEGSTAGGYFHHSDVAGGYARVAQSSNGVEGGGPSSGGYFMDTDNSGYAYVGYGDIGVKGEGDVAGGHFIDGDDATSFSYIGYASYGIWGEGSAAGGYFHHSDVAGGYARLAQSNRGIEAGGSSSGGYFMDTDGTGSAYVGYGDYGIQGSGSEAGAKFDDTNGSGEAWVARGNYGIEARGGAAGGYIHHTTGSGEAWLGENGTGVHGKGDTPGLFENNNATPSEVRLAEGSTGIEAFGYTLGGSFSNSEAEVLIANFPSGSPIGAAGIEIRDPAHTIDYGVYIEADGVGGYFEDITGSGHASLGTGDRGISAAGSNAAGYFYETDTVAEAWLAWKNAGLEAKGDWVGGLFQDVTESGTAYVAYGNEGIRASGNDSGGYFFDADQTTAWGRVGQYYAGAPYKIRGNGTVSFVQNHPERSDRVVVYAAPEGDEVAVYTRGSARLVDGEARISLGETFKWVANPDIGLTAHLTPRGEEPVPLSVLSLTTSELTVRGPVDSEARFDYMVYGLRLGFEQMTPVQDKQDFAPVPELDSTASYYAHFPDLRRFNPLERFAAMREGVGEEPADLSRTRELLAAVNRFDPEIDGPLQPVEHLRGREGTIEQRPAPITGDVIRPTGGPVESGDPAAEATEAIPMDADGNVYARSFRPSATDFASLSPVSGPVEPGDVLVIDPAQPGLMSLSRQEADTRVFGIVAGEPGVILGAQQPGEISTTDEQVPESVGTWEAPVAHSGVVLCKVDAGYGSILPGDLLVTSPTPAHAMRTDEPRPGTMLGKALEPLEAGTGRIRVLVMLR